MRNTLLSSGEGRTRDLPGQLLTRAVPLLTLALLAAAAAGAPARELTPDQIAAGRRAVAHYLEAEDVAARQMAVETLRALGQPAITHFKALLALEERTLLEQPIEMMASFAIGTLLGHASLQLPATAQLGSELAPLVIVLLPSQLDELEAGEGLARLLGGVFTEAGWIVAALRPIKLDDKLSFRVDQTRPAFVRWTRGSAELVPWLVAHLLRVLPIDPARVHVLGFGDGGDGSLWAASRYADRFASATAIDARFSGKAPLRWLGNLGNLKVVVGHGAYQRDWRPAEKGGMLVLLREHGVSTEYLPIPEEEHFPTEALLEMLEPMRRHTIDRVVRWFTDRPGFGAFQWVRVDACGGSARIRVEADRKTNTIDIHDAREVRGLSFLVDSLVLDPGRPVIIRHHDRTVYRGSPAPSIELLLESWRLCGDVTRLYSKSISLEIR